MELPSEKLNELRQIIHNHLDKIDIHGRIRQVLSESQHENDERIVEEDGLLASLKQRGVIEDIMKSLNFKELDQERKIREMKLKEPGKQQKVDFFSGDLQQEKCEMFSFLQESVFKQFF